MNADEFVAGILAGNRGVLARAITLVESSRPDHQELAENILDRCLGFDSVRAGITGVPGVGKSTFIERLGLHLTQDRGEKVAVLAIDPSSPVSGGSILGDKTRMQKLSADPNAFIRPSPSRGALGGVTRRTRETILLCEAAGFSNILVETVGVGQSEMTVASMVDFFLLLMLAGAGDELQAIKRGILEVTDLVAINKADGDNLHAAQLARSEYASAIGPDKVVLCSAMTGAGIPEIWIRVLEHGKAARADQASRWLYDAIDNGLHERFFQNPAVKDLLPKLEAAVSAGELTAVRAARQLLDQSRG